jgi:hypothetical protein
MMRNIFIAFLFIACIGCKDTEKKPAIVEETIYQNDIAVAEAVENLTTLRNGDKITFDINLTMEHFVRVDIVIVKKENDTLYVSVRTADKVEALDDDFVISKVSWKKYSAKQSDTLDLEHFFSKKLNQTAKNNAHTYTANIFTQSDTITLYTYNLAEKARFVKEYFRVMGNLFPKENKFKPKNETFPE